MNSFNLFAPTTQISTSTILNTKKDQKFKDVLWTVDIEKELPIFMNKKDPTSSIPPTTLMEIFEETCRNNPKDEALFFERGGQWHSWTWNHYHKEVINFAKALINIGVEPYRTVNILAFNSPEWFVSFLGGVYACVVPTGIYLTNNSETCVYIAEHSECGCLVVDSLEQYQKYEKSLSKLKHMKAVVFTCDLKEQDLKSLLNPYITIYLWRDFIELGGKASNDLEFENRIRMQTPGNCCNIVYTSGTTGVPKAVLLSHDNMTWTGNCMIKNFAHLYGEKNRVVSYLPLSHIAGQIQDIICKIIFINHKF
jgi:long-chain-fatty-acid--CoA ligase ACSBG